MTENILTVSNNNLLLDFKSTYGLSKHHNESFATDQAMYWTYVPHHSHTLNQSVLTITTKSRTFYVRNTPMILQQHPQRTTWLTVQQLELISREVVYLYEVFSCVEMVYDDVLLII